MINDTSPSQSSFLFTFSLPLSLLSIKATPFFENVAELLHVFLLAQSDDGA